MRDQFAQKHGSHQSEAMTAYHTVSEWNVKSDQNPIPGVCMTGSNELKNLGLKATLPRRTILEVFQRSDRRHLTAEDVYRVLVGERQDIGLATVYRVLTQFEQAGLLTRSHFEAGKAVFELQEGGHHDHLVCVTCGHVEEFYDSQIEERQQHIATERGFELQDHALSLYAVCVKPDCQHRLTAGMLPVSASRG